MAHGKLESLITIPTGGWTFKLTHSGEGQKTINFTAGKTYYWSSAGNDTVDFAARMEALIDAQFVADFTVTISAGESGTGYLTIAVAGGGTIDAYADVSTGLEELCKFDNATYGATSINEAAAGALWLPNCPVETPFGVDDDGWEEADGNSTTAPDGTTVSTLYNVRTVNRLSWSHVQDKYARISATAASTDTNGTFQRFNNRCIWGQADWASPGGPVRWYPDAGTDGTYTEYAVPVGNRHAPSRIVPNYSGWYTIEIPRMIKVP